MRDSLRLLHDFEVLENKKCSWNYIYYIFHFNIPERSLISFYVVVDIKELSQNMSSSSSTTEGNNVLNLTDKIPEIDMDNSVSDSTTGISNVVICKNFVIIIIICTAGADCNTVIYFFASLHAFMNNTTVLLTTTLLLLKVITSSILHLIWYYFFP